MRTVTNRWRTVADSADITIRSEAVFLDDDGEQVGPPLTFTEGSVTEDASTEVRSDFSITATVDADTPIPSTLADRVLPFGKRARLSMGFEYPDIDPEMVTVATGWLTLTSFQSGTSTIPLNGLDRASRLQAPSPRPVSIPAGRPVPAAIRDLLSTIDPTISYDLMASQWTSPRLVHEVETDLWSEADQMATSIGAELFVSRDDRVTLRPIPRPARPAVWSFTEGVNATVLNAEQRWSTDQIPNGVIVIGTHSSLSGSVTAAVWDEDPTSPTYRFGPYGEKPKFVRSEKVASFGQALAMAKGELERRLGGANEIELSVVPNPAIEAGDVVEVRLGSIGASGLRVVESVTISLEDHSAGMSLRLRSGVTM